MSALAKARAVDDAASMWRKLFGTFWPAGLRWSGRASWALVATEAATGAFLLLGGAFRRPSLVLAIGLLAAFALLALFSARTALDIPCACFGSARASLGWRHVWRNATLLALGITAAVLAPADKGTEWALGGIGVAVISAFFVTLVAFFYDDIVDLLGSDRHA